ncbi:hypothetical protein H0X10_01060 [Candidatus Saccharibacteria bacterium]|nr:hypothetical protein [Candidatus Saccharibacteria bacterium]
MTKAMNIASIEKATNKLWGQWVIELDDSGSRELSHSELARKLYDELDGKVESHGWWAQGITVAYEQHIGKRIPGQLANGLFELAISKAIPKPRDVVFSQVTEWLEQQVEFNGREQLKARSSTTPKRSNWRCDFSDKSKFAATVEGNDEKSKLVLSHTAVPSKTEADIWKVYWRNVANQLATL